MRNLIIMMARGIGLCGVDRLLEDDGQEGLSPQEAISFLRVQDNFNFSYCDRYKSTAYLALVGLGLGFRLVAYLFLRRSCVTRH
ncbi:hypothetical protein TSOC_005907 [Tetrabaena socialis]|uniref:Uncharacterized protein n=1 Tax=Tetrabaena socialis TaxID=47790 RepID=A0A2J8A520_9CHLO|nr:hypothetical protein TSOC_005907 [Tetrabaena socialis]|eukprot:PNH07624.1 hypothetical protein TSOC_005907 [Tetrabaena socialis]